MFISGLGAFFFGLLLGWVFYRTLRLHGSASGLAEIASIIGVLGGAAILSLFKSDVLFGWYATGLFIGFAAYLILDLQQNGPQQILPWRRTIAPPPIILPTETPGSTGEMAE